MSEASPLTYVPKEKATHLSYGFKKGNYIITDKNLKTICESDYYFKNFCLVEVKTPFYVLMFDFDFHSNHENSIEYANNADLIVNHTIDHINSVLKKTFHNPNISYVYSDKNVDKGVHLYYPNIIINKTVHQYIYNTVLDILIKKNKYKLNDEDWKNIFDCCITKSNGLRFPFFYKDGTYYKINENKSTHDIPESKYEKVKLCCIRSNKTDVYPKLKIATQMDDEVITKSVTKKTNVKLVINPKEEIIVEHIPKTELDGLLSCFKEEMFIKYNKWWNMGWFIFNSNNTVDGLELFYKYSKVGQYSNVSYDVIRDHFYKYKISDYFNPNILRYQARRENQKLFDKLVLNIPYDKREFKAITFSDAKLINIISDDPSYIQKEFDEFAKSNDPYFLLKSPYDTGKTTMSNHICKKYNYEKILFVTHRQSLARDITNDFEALGFVNYLDKTKFKVDGDRLIINIDSLHLLKSAYNFFSEKSNLKMFDLIILDECESLLKHFESNLMHDKDSIYTIFHDLIENTKKVICFDGDLSNRSYHYFKRFNQDVKIYENQHIPRKYHYVFGYDELVYTDMLKHDLKSGKNCAVISMSAQFCEKVHKMFCGTYKTVILTGKSENELKKQLADAKKLLKDVQLFIYSPCITVGVNVAFEHFDKLYGFICNMSITARDFMQMVARIRKPVSNIINVLIDPKISKSQIGNYYTFEEIKLSYANEYGYNPNDLTTYQTLRLWNKFEDVNNKLYLFPILLHYIKQKGHTYEIKDEKSFKIHDKVQAIDVINAVNINSTTYKTLLKKQKEDCLTQAERLSIEKYLYGKYFDTSLAEINQSFMNTHYGKLDVAKTHIDFLKYMNKGKKELILIHETNEYDYEQKIKKMEYIKKVVNKLGFNKLDELVDKESFGKNVVDMFKIVDDGFRMAFEMKKEVVDKVSKKCDTNKKVLGWLNSLLGSVGVEIKCVQKTFKKLGKYERLIIGYKYKKINILVDL